MFGINLDASSNNTISGNIITENENGIHLRWSSHDNIIHGNYIAVNTATGAYMAEPSDNRITWNHTADNQRSTYTEYCGINIIHHNNFLNNTKQ